VETILGNNRSLGSDLTRKNHHFRKTRDPRGRERQPDQNDNDNKIVTRQRQASGFVAVVRLDGWRTRESCVIGGM